MLGRRRWMVMAAAALALGASAIGCGKGGSSGEPKWKAANATEWKIGGYFSLSGEDTAFGTDSKEGIDLAVDEINKAGGVKGKLIKILYEDDKSKPDEATNKVIQLIDRDGVIALLGEVASSRSRNGGIVANREKIPMITPASTNVDVTKVGPFVFRVCFTDDVQGQLGAQFAVNKLGKKKIAILFASDDLYSSGLAKEFRDEAKKLGAEIVIEKGFLKKETNFTTFINEIKSAGPDIIYTPVYYNQMSQIARQAKAAEVPGTMFLGGDGWDAAELVRDAGEELEGAFFTNHYAPDIPSPRAQEFVSKYKERYSRSPTSMAALAYDTARLMADAIGRAKVDTPDGIREAISQTSGFEGATGTITIDANRNAAKPIVIVQIKNKQFTYYATVDNPAAAPK